MFTRDCAFVCFIIIITRLLFLCERVWWWMRTKVGAGTRWWMLEDVRAYNDREKERERRVVVRREEKSFVLIENEFVLLILEKKGKLMVTMMMNKTYRHVDAFLAPLLRWRAMLLLEQRGWWWRRSRWWSNNHRLCCGSRKHIFILLVMETIQLRASAKRGFLLFQKPSFPGFFVSPIFGLLSILSFQHSVFVHTTTKNAHTSKRHAKICCAQNYYGDYYYY